MLKQFGKRARAASLDAGRSFALCLVLLVAASTFLDGNGHAHAAIGGEAHFSSQHVQGADGIGHALFAPCEDGSDQDAGPGSCCMSTSACGFCIPVPVVDLAIAVRGGPAATTPQSASSPGEADPQMRPPRLSVTA
jgi:hypothetical protein